MWHVQRFKSIESVQQQYALIFGTDLGVAHPGLSASCLLHASMHSSGCGFVVQHNSMCERFQRSVLGFVLGLGDVVVLALASDVSGQDLDCLNRLMLALFERQYAWCGVCEPSIWAMTNPHCK
jgi:hypothetical protein